MYVGMNRIRYFVFKYRYGVPHVRGDEPSVNTTYQNEEERSPCTWG